MSAASALREKFSAFAAEPGFEVLHKVGREVLLATFTLNLLALALPIVLLQVYDRIILNAATGTLSLLVTGLCVALLLEALLRLLRSALTGWAGAKFEHEMGSRLAGRLFGASLQDLERVPAGTHLDRFNAIETVRDFYANQAAMLLIDLPFVFVYMGLLFIIAGPLVLVPVAIIALFLAASKEIGDRLRSALHQRMLWDDRRRSLLIEILSGIHTVKGLAMEALMMRRFERLQDSSVAASYTVTYLGTLAQTLGASFSVLSMIAITAIGSLAVIEDALSVGGLAASVMLAGRTIQPLLQAAGIYTQFQNVRIAQERIQEVMTYRPESEGRGEESGTIAGAIELANVSFAYGPDAPPILKNVSLTIETGETIGIVGGNGSGKSTLLWLLFAGLVPSEGQVLVDGIDARDYDLASLRKQIAYLPQAGVLFRGTVLENLTLFQDGLAIDYAQILAGKLGLDRYFATMPAGFDTVVADSITNTLPAGVIQRVAIARAVAGAPRIILFDDANSALDAEGDRQVTELISEMRGCATIILVTHRPSLLALSDRVFVLDKGALAPRREQADDQKASV